MTVSTTFNLTTEQILKIVKQAENFSTQHEVALEVAFVLITYLIYLTTAIKSGSLGKAATELNTTRQAVSAGISSLERELGATLIVRDQHGVSLTDAGELVLPQIYKILDAYNEMKTQLNLIPAEEKVNLLVYYLPIFTSIIDEVLVRFSAKHPSVSIQCFECDHADIFKPLKENDNSLAIHQFFEEYDTKPDDTELLSWTLPLTIQLYAVMSRDHPLADQPRLSMSSIVKYPICLYTISDSGALYKRLLKYEGVSFAVRTDNVGLYCRKIANGDAVGFLPRINGHALTPYNDLLKSPVYIPLDEMKPSRVICYTSANIDSEYLALYKMLTKDLVDAVTKRLD